MADNDIATTAKGGGKASIDAGMALFAALAVGFAGFAMPADLFQRLFGATAAAVPDSAARIAAAAAAAILTLALVFKLLRALGRIAPAKRRSAAEMPADPPRLRKADAHPDAPSRLPVFARHELGAPIPAEQPEVETPAAIEEIAEQPDVETPVTVPEIAEQPADELLLEAEHTLPGLLGAGLDISDGEPVEREPVEAAEPARPLPTFIAPAEPEAVEAPETVAPELPVQAGAAPIIEAIPEEAAEPAPIVDETPERADEIMEAEPVAIENVLAEAIPIVDERPEPAPIAASIVEQAVIPFAQDVEPEPAIADRVEPVAEDEPFAAERDDDPAEAHVPTPEPAAPVDEAPTEPADSTETIAELASRIPQLPAARDENVSDLIGRLEVGLGRRDRAAWLGSDGESDAPPADDRLRGAIGKLRKMARKG